MKHLLTVILSLVIIFLAYIIYWGESKEHEYQNKCTASDGTMIISRTGERFCINSLLLKRIK